MITNYKDLNVWKEAMEIVAIVYRLTARFPKDETYGLVSQMRRAAVSIPSNIAEGSRRNTTKDFVHFLAIASGSTAELETQLLIALQLKYCEENEMTYLLDLCDKTVRSLTKLQQSRSAHA